MSSVVAQRAAPIIPVGARLYRPLAAYAYTLLWVTTGAIFVPHGIPKRFFAVARGWLARAPAGPGDLHPGWHPEALLRRRERRARLSARRPGAHRRGARGARHPGAADGAAPHQRPADGDRRQHGEGMAVDTRRRAVPHLSPRHA